MARLAKNRRRAVQKIFPPKKCAGHTTAGDPCDRDAIVGASVCYTHGGHAPQVRAKAEERVTLAEALVRSDKRQPWEVLEDAAHIADVLMQDARLDIEQGAFTPEALDKLISSLDRAHRLSTSNVHAGLAERRQRFAEGQAQIMHRFVVRVLDGLGLTPEQRALVPDVVKREIEGVLVQSKAEVLIAA